MKRISTVIAAIALTASLAACGNSSKTPGVTADGDLAPAAGEIGDTKVGERHSFGYYEDEVSLAVTEITSGGECRYGKPDQADAPPAGWKLLQITGDAEGKSVSDSGWTAPVVFIGADGKTWMGDQLTMEREKDTEHDPEATYTCSEPEPAEGYLPWHAYVYEGDKIRFYGHYIVPENIEKVKVETAVYDLADAQPNTEVIPPKRDER